MRLGYMAFGRRCGRVEHLGNPDRPPRVQLLEKLGVQHAEKMYVDDKEGTTHHIGYIVQGEWWEILEVHNWEGGKKVS